MWRIERIPDASLGDPRVDRCVMQADAGGAHPARGTRRGNARPRSRRRMRQRVGAPFIPPPQVQRGALQYMRCKEL